MTGPTREEVERPTLAALIDLIGELGRQVHCLLDDCETSGNVGEEVHTITTEGLAAVSEVLDRIDALPFEEPGYILGTGSMLQAALKQTLAAENAALRERLEAAEAERDVFKKYMEAYAECDRISTKACRELDAELTEARAREAAAWEAGRDAMMPTVKANCRICGGTGYSGGFGGTNCEPVLYPCGHGVERITPPTDATAALTARLDAEWNACVDEMLDRCDLFGGQILDGHIRALRRNPKEGV